MEIKQNEYELFQQFLQFKEMQEQSTIVPTHPTQSRKESKERKRREKESGGIVNLGKTRARPYMACVSIGYDDDNGNQLQAPIGYFREHKQAERVLDLYSLESKGKCSIGTVLEYIQSVDGSFPKESKFEEIRKLFNCEKIIDNVPTVKEVWNNLLESDLFHLTNRSLTNYKVSFKHFEKIHNRKITDIKLTDIQPYFDELMDKGTGQSKMNNMKIVLNYIFKYACKYDYIEKNYASFISFRETLDEQQKKKKQPYSKEIIRDLFKRDEDIIVQSILVMIYTGMRPSELLKLNPSDIHIEDRYMIGGIKTENGINRIIPIHECIVDYVRNISTSNLINMYYQDYLIRYNEVKAQLGFVNTPHSGRHTFATLSNENSLDEFLVKKIMGHSAKDLTKDVYTHVDTERLIKEINKLPIYK